MENLKDALQYLVSLGEEEASPEVLEICGKTYATKKLVRYGEREYASDLEVSSLTAILDYIAAAVSEFRQDMILHVQSPKRVTLVSLLDEERRRERLLTADANVSEFGFDRWYDQERFIMELQANFLPNEDLELLQAVAGNVEGGTTANYGDDGVSQKTTIKSGIATREDVIVPNPATLIPYRTFPEIEQPESKFVFRIRDNRNDAPEFKLLEADGGAWKNEVIARIKEYLQNCLGSIDCPFRIHVIG